VKTSGGAGAPGAQSGPLGDAGDLVSGALGADEGGGGEGGDGAQTGTGPQSAPGTSFVDVPGPGLAIGLVVLASLALVVSRRRAF
jgi:hypothetical protein